MLKNVEKTNNNPGSDLSNCMTSPAITLRASFFCGKTEQLTEYLHQDTFQEGGGEEKKMAVFLDFTVRKSNKRCLTISCKTF